MRARNNSFPESVEHQLIAFSVTQLNIAQTPFIVKLEQLENVLTAWTPRENSVIELSSINKVIV